MKYTTIYRLIFLTLLWALIGCQSRKKPEAKRADVPKESQASKPSAIEPSLTKADPVDAKSVFGAAAFPGAPRIVAIGDLHGDYNATLRAFALAGATSFPRGGEEAHWIGKKLVVVQTGDQLDRGDGELEIMRFLKRMKQEAQAAGGALYVLNGNHETMNAMGDFRYVTPKGFQSFQGLQSPSPLVQRFAQSMQGRAAAFLPRGVWATELAKQPLVIQVGSTLFAHGGVLPAHLNYGIARLNKETADWLAGLRAQPPSLVVSSDGPLWTRLYGSPKVSSAACTTLNEVLQKTNSKLLVVGHTVQPGGVNFACAGKLARIDVGLSAHYAAPQVSILEIANEGLKVIEGPLPRVAPPH